MESDKPLHARVAEALGWTEINLRLSTGYPPEGPIGGHERRAPGWPPRLEATSVPRYDTDWSATGPLIEKYHMILGPFGDSGWNAVIPGVEWPSVHDHRGRGETPLIAVCNLILALKEAGKLNP